MSELYPDPGFDFDAAVTAPFRMQPGLRRLAPGTRQLTDLRPDSPAFAEKLAVLSRHADQALVCADGFDPLPALQALARQAAACGAGQLRADEHHVSATSIGWRVTWDGDLDRLDAGAHADAHADSHAHAHAHAEAGRCLAALPRDQRVAGLLCLAVHEDLAIVDGDRATLPWMAVCLPSHWVPAEKIGRSFATVHGPVADNATLLAAAAHLSRLVCQPQRWERFVWNITPHGGHDLHPLRHPRTPWPDDAATLIAQAHWRTEHQTFLPLPDQGQAVFTIHVAVQPLATAIDSPARAAALHASLGSMSEAVLAYRSLADAQAPLLDWLAQRAGPRPAPLDSAAP